MPNIKEQALIDAATRVLKEKKEPLEFYELFNIVCGEKEYSDELKLELVTQFYTDISTSAKFVYTGDNMWDLKEHQKTELWEKDGSFYKEYTEIVASDYVVTKAVEPVETVVEKPAAVEKPEIIKVEKPEKADKIDRAKLERVFAEKADPGVVRDEDYVDYDEVIEDEEEDDFDEEKYNEYMDTYEDQYKD